MTSIVAFPVSEARIRRIPPGRFSGPYTYAAERAGSSSMPRRDVEAANGGPAPVGATGTSSKRPESGAPERPSANVTSTPPGSRPCAARSKPRSTGSSARPRRTSSPAAWPTSGHGRVRTPWRSRDRSATKRRRAVQGACRADQGRAVAEPAASRRVRLVPAGVWYYPTRSVGRFCSLSCRSFFNNLQRSRTSSAHPSGDGGGPRRRRAVSRLHAAHAAPPTRVVAPSGPSSSPGPPRALSLS